MMARLSSFADLLAPVRPETFFARHWETQPCGFYPGRSQPLHVGAMLIYAEW